MTIDHYCDPPNPADTPVELGDDWTCPECGRTFSAFNAIAYLPAKAQRRALEGDGVHLGWTANSTT